MPRVGRPGRPPKVKSKEPSEDGQISSSSSSADLMTMSSVVAGSSNMDVSSASSVSGLPSSSNLLDESYSYTAPSWLLQEKQLPKSFSIPLPSIAQKTLQAIQDYIGQTEGNLERRQARKQTSLALDKWRNLQQDQRNTESKLKSQTQKLANLVDQQKEHMEELKETHQQNRQTAIRKLEKDLQAEYQQKIKQETDRFKQEIEANFEKEFEAEQAKLEQEEKSTDEGIVEEPPTKKLKTEEPSEVTKSDTAAVLESDQLQAKIEANKAEMDKLQEMKSEIVWLLKQIIKADAKRKANLARQKDTSEGGASTGKVES